MSLEVKPNITAEQRYAITQSPEYAKGMDKIERINEVEIKEDEYGLISTHTTTAMKLLTFTTIGGTYEDYRNMFNFCTFEEKKPINIKLLSRACNFLQNLNCQNLEMELEHYVELMECVNTILNKINKIIIPLREELIIQLHNKFKAKASIIK